MWSSFKIPRKVLAHLEGFVASCGQWRDPYSAVNETSLAFFKARSSLWQRNVFNAGQFACDRPLFAADQLKELIQRPDLAAACFRHPSNSFLVNDQTGLNLLVHESNVPMTNLNLPPSEMESTWAGDYPADFAPYWVSRKRTPYLIHWAGVRMDAVRPINKLFYDYLTRSERGEFDRQTRDLILRSRQEARSVRSRARRVRNAMSVLLRE